MPDATAALAACDFHGKSARHQFQIWLILGRMPAADQTSSKNSKAAVFLRRALSAIVLWTVVLVALFSPYEQISNYVFLAAMVWLTWAGMAEFYDMAGRRGLPCFKYSGIVGGVLLAVGTHIALAAPQLRVAGNYEANFLALFILCLSLLQLFSKSGRSAFNTISITLLGFLYVPWLLGFLQKIYFFPANGRTYLFYFILVTKFSDMGAYLVGSLIGRHKMFPRISPGKTWEGFVGAIVFSAGASVLFSLLAKRELAGLDLSDALILGIVLGAAAVLGDLVESLFKREAGVKDSGLLFPGIGGVLDLLDSLLFNAPLMYLYMRFVL
jgi:phosphatidate cytidylyltransferase